MLSFVDCCINGHSAGFVALMEIVDLLGFVDCCIDGKFAYYKEMESADERR